MKSEFHVVEPRDTTPMCPLPVVRYAVRLPELVLTAEAGLDLTCGAPRAPLPMSTAFRYLTMLEELGHFKWDASASIDHLGLKPLQLGQVARDRG